MKRNDLRMSVVARVGNTGAELHHYGFSLCGGPAADNTASKIFDLINGPLVCEL